jgi:aryl-alcohol dehydrogenase-like predicted oxidoreductase
MGGWSGSDDGESLVPLQLAVDLGCNFFDSAWGYGEGKSDSLLGRIIRLDKVKLCSASKIPPMNQRWPELPQYKYAEVFPRPNVFKYADLIRKNLGLIQLTYSNFMCGQIRGPTSLISARPQKS